MTYEEYMETKTLLLILLTTTVSCSQSKQVFDVNQPYDGFIVSQDIEIYVGDKANWFKPTQEEVKEAEELLSEQIERLNTEQINQENDCPIIDQNLNKYLRQYIGYINVFGEKVILMNMLWSDKIENHKGLRSELAMVLDGCSRYWKVKVNLTSDIVYDLEIKLTFTFQ